MTPAEQKVREISDKLVNRIDELREAGYDDASILASVRNYLIGITDGIDFAEEMRNQDSRELEPLAVLKQYQETETEQDKDILNLNCDFSEL